MIMKILLMGGVGNRLFQISYGLSASQQKSIVLITLPRYIEGFASLFGWSYHQEWINIKNLCLKLNLNNRTANLAEIFIVFAMFFLRKISSKFSKEIDIESLRTERYLFDFAIGYFQEPHYHKKEELKIIIRELSKIYSNDQSKYSCIHIRGGDLAIDDRLKDDFIKNIDYKNDLKIVTNDVIYAKNLFRDIDAKIFSNKNPADDFKVICNSKLLYISNSTYSFWASCIVFHNGGRVIFTEDFYLKDFFKFLDYHA